MAASFLFKLMQPHEMGEPMKSNVEIAREKDAEIARLRAENGTLDVMAEVGFNGTMDKSAEIARLTAYQNETALAWTKLTDSQEQEIARLTAERDMAMAAHQEIIRKYEKIMGEPPDWTDFKGDDVRLKWAREAWFGAAQISRNALGRLEQTKGGSFYN